VSLQSVTAELAAQAAVADALSPIVQQGAGGILPAVSGILRSAVSGLIGVSPQWLHPVEIVLGTDLVTLAELQPSTDSALRLAVSAPTCMLHTYPFLDLPRGRHAEASSNACKRILWQ
jgi:hypothetical protein